MGSFTDLNTYSQTEIEYTDQRNPRPVFNIPAPSDLDFTATATSFTILRELTVLEFIRPEALNFQFQVDVSGVSGSSVDFGTLPAGLTVSTVNGVYTVSGITTVAQWDQIKDPVITIPDTFQGSFFYAVNFVWQDSTGTNTLSYDVGTYVPVAELIAESSVTITGTRVEGLIPELFQVTAQLDLISNPTIAPAVFDSQFVFSVEGTVIELSLTNPNDLNYTTNRGFTLTSASNIENSSPPDLYSMNINVQNSNHVQNIYSKDITRISKNSLTNLSNRLQGSGSSANYYAVGARVYNKSDNTLVYDFTPSSPDARVVKITPDENYIAIADALRTAKVYNLNNGTLAYTLTIENASGINIDVDNTYIALSYYNTITDVYYISTGQLYSELAVGGIDVTLDGQNILIDNTLYNINTGTSIWSYPITEGDEFVNSISNGLVFFGLRTDSFSDLGGVVQIFDYSDQSLVTTITVPEGFDRYAYSFCDEYIFIRTSMTNFPQTDYYYIYDTSNFSLIESWNEPQSGIVAESDETIYIDRDILIYAYEDVNPDPNTIGAIVETISQPVFWNENTKTATITGTINEINTVMNSNDICVIPTLDLSQTIVLEYQASSNTTTIESTVVDQNITNI